MKRRFTILSAALALLAMLAIPMGMWGQTSTELTYVFSEHYSTNTTLDGTLISLDNLITATFNKANGSTAPQYYTNGTAVRWYAKGTLVIASSNATISEIEITYTQNNNSVTASVGDYTHPSGAGTGTWSGSASSVTFTQGGTSGHNRVSVISVTYTTSGSQPTIYTVTFDAGDGTFVGSTDFPNASNTMAAGTYTLPSAERSGYTFDGWTATGITTPVTGSYTVSGNVDFTAQYTQNSGSGVTATLTQSNLELTGSYTTNTSKTIDGITYVYTDLMKSSDNIQAKASTGTIKNTTAYPGDITEVKITHSGTARATTINGSADGTNWTQVATGSGSITADFSGRGYKYFQITRGSNAAYWTKIEITYSTGGSSQSQSDLAITNASTDLTFDLYNNATAQVINYTTSSTGAITITPAESSYFTYVHDATAKTITVTPTAVTPSAQTVTISQEADEDYYAGTASFTVSVANSDPNLPGTVNNPYTVAEAIAATPSSGNVYIQGIVSSFYNTSIVGDGTNYRYYISDDGTTTTQLLVYRGKGLNQATFTNADDLLVGDEVVICGTLVMYNNAPEINSGNYLYSWNRPVAAVEAPTFSPAAGTFTTAQTVTLSCATTGATIYYTLDGTEPTNASTEYTSALTISSTTTVKAIAYVGSDASTVATATYHFCSAEDPYTVTEALAFNEYPANGIYVHGIVSTAPTQNPTSNGELTYYISVDGQDANQLEVYKGKGLNEAEFEAKDDIQVGDIVTIYGNVVIYNGAKEFSSGNYLVSFERPAQQYTLTVTCSENVEIFTFVGESTDPGVEGSTILQVTNGTEVGLSVSVSEGYVLTLIVDDENVTSDLDDTGYYTFSMPSHAVTVTATAVEDVPPTPGDKYVKVTSTDDLTSGQYLIVYEDGGLAFDGSLEILDAVGNTIEVTIRNNEIEVNTTTAASEFTIDMSVGTIKSASGYFIGRTTNSNGMNYSQSDAYTNTISIDDSYNAVITSSANPTLRFNDASNQNRFRYYGSGQKAIQLYKKVVAEETYTLEIAGYGNSDGGYYLIASPVTVDPATVDGMTEGDYDLYYFDQAEEKEWQNYKDTDGTGYFNLVPGKGYLYAHKTGGQFTLTGTPYSGDGKVTLNKTNDTNADFQGWNLVGNPYAEIAHITTQEGHALNFYTLTSAGDEFEAATNTSVQSMEGVFVVAQEDGEEITFTKGEGAKGSLVALNLSNGRNVIDRTIVRFDECRQLPKFQLNPNHTKVYIPVDGEDYALVRGEEMGAMPVNFKAENNGTYTLSLSSENVEFAYLHLIDNMTGADIDLLQTPSYSFEAKTTDYSQRFKLVFATGDNSNEDNFAFFSNGSFVINNEGNAALQVIDVNGRILKSESINGCANVNVNAAAGVYMLRLVNGDNVKVQKVVVK